MYNYIVVKKVSGVVGCMVAAKLVEGLIWAKIVILFLQFHEVNYNKAFRYYVWFKKSLLDQPNTCTVGVQYYHGLLILSQLLCL